MVRPCFLVIDHEHAGAISTRKLVIESAKFNVITAFSREEAVATLKRFPAVDGVIMDAVVSDAPSDDLVRQLKEMSPDLPMIVISMRGVAPPIGADYVLESFEPVSLLALLRTLEPRRTQEILVHDDELRRQEKLSDNSGSKGSHT